MPSSAVIKHFYYNGRRITADEALDADGAIRDGVVLRVPMFMRDGHLNPSMTPLQQEVATYRGRLTDASGSTDQFAFSRPGYRILHDAAAREARETAYQRYEDELVNAWKAPNGFGIGNRGSGS
jgi:hypothetical protein